MSVLKDRIIFVDVEATCWRGRPPQGQRNEIIEIGICEYDIPSRRLQNKRSVLVRPRYSTISAFCTELTTLTQDMVDGGLSFDDACAVLERDYHTPTTIWGSWGNFDRRIFQEQCQLFGVDYPFSDQHINIKRLFQNANRLPYAPGLARACRIAGLDMEGTHHRGHDDAWNVGRLFHELIIEYGDKLLERYWG